MQNCEHCCSDPVPQQIHKTSKKTQLFAHNVFKTLIYT